MGSCGEDRISSNKGFFSLRPEAPGPGPEPGEERPSLQRWEVAVPGGEGLRLGAAGGPRTDQLAHPTG